MRKKEITSYKSFLQNLLCGCVIILVITLGGFGYSKEKRGARIGNQLLLQAIGDWSYRQTNFYLDNYDFFGGWSTAKLVWYNDSIHFGIFITAIIAQSNRGKSWENNYVFGLGVEKYIFEDLKKIYGFFKNIRFYLEYLKIEYTNEEAEEWIPTYNVRIGFDVYKDYGIGKDKVNKRLWGEVWGNIGWQKTNFYIKDYNSIVAGVNIKTGFRLLKNTPLSPMPYLVGEASWTSRHNFFWQNRGFLGIGLRLMPFAKSNLDLWNRFKFFAEYFFTVVYFKDKPQTSIPDYDFRVGINYSIGLWK